MSLITDWEFYYIVLEWVYNLVLANDVTKYPGVLQGNVPTLEKKQTGIDIPHTCQIYKGCLVIWEPSC